MRALRRRLPGALALSLALHGVLLLVLRAQAPLVVPAPRVEGSQRVEVEVLPSAEPVRPQSERPDAPEPVQSPEPPSEPPAPTAEGGPPAPAPVVQAPVVQAPAQPPGTQAPLAQGPKGGQRPGREQSGDVAVSPGGLVPVIPGVEANEAARATPGITVRNGEGPAEDPAVAAREAAEGKRVVEGAIADGRAEYRVRTGLVDPYFLDMAKALRRGASNPPRLVPGKTFVEELVAAWGAGAEAYGRSGNPYGEGQRPEVPAQLDEGSLLGRKLADDPNSPLREHLQRQQAGSGLREFADGKFGKPIVALVEIRQGRDGTLLSASLVQSSGNPVWDKHAVSGVKDSLAALSPPTQGGLGVGAHGTRTLWAYEVRITHKRKLGKGAGPIKPEESLGLLAQGALSALSGGWFPAGAVTFDPVTGEGSVVDLTHAAYEPTVKLLRVY